MAERVETKLRERDRALENVHPYEVFFSAFKERRRLAHEGQVVIKGKDLPWQQSRQGRSKYFLHMRGREPSRAGLDARSRRTSRRSPGRTPTRAAWSSTSPKARATASSTASSTRGSQAIS